MMQYEDGKKQTLLRCSDILTKTGRHNAKTEAKNFCP